MSPRTLVPLLLVLAACNGKDGLVVVHVDAAPPLDGVASLAVDATVGATARSFAVPLSGAPIALPPERSFGIEVPPGLGDTVTVHVTALDAQLAPLAEGQGTTTVGSGRSDLTVVLGPAPVPDLATPSYAPPRLVAPLSGSRMTMLRPLLRFELPPGALDASLEWCATRGCASPLGTTAIAGGATTVRPGADLPVGVVFWRVRARFAGGESLSPWWELSTPFRAAPRDAIVGTFLDVNGDGLGDLVSVAYVGPSAMQPPSRFFAWHGTRGGGPFAAAPTPELAAPSGSHAWSVVPAGDVNGDGYGDVVAGDPFAVRNSGQLLLWLGGPSGLGAQPQVILGDVQYTDSVGYGVTAAGDLDGDGYGDVVAFGASPIRGVQVYRGGPNGLAPTAALVVDAPATASGGFGLRSAGSGDFDGDGHPDVAVSAYFESGGGAAYVFRGGPSLLEPTPVRLTATGTSEFGWSLALAGDVNGDGYADLVVGDEYYLNARACLFLGGAGGPATTPDVTWLAPAQQTGFAYSLGGGGDVDGDGYDDVLIANEQQGGGAGGFYVYFGAGSNLATPRTVERMGIQGGDYAGGTAALRDADGDGRADLVVGAPSSNSSSGRIFVYRGAASPNTVPDQILDLLLPAGEQLGYGLARLFPPHRAALRGQRTGVAHARAL